MPKTITCRNCEWKGQETDAKIKERNVAQLDYHSIEIICPDCNSTITWKR